MGDQAKMVQKVQLANPDCLGFRVHQENLETQVKMVDQDVMAILETPDRKEIKETKEKQLLDLLVNQESKVLLVLQGFLVNLAKKENLERMQESMILKEC